jgi:F0F1-type ATP synthase assembly protein I
MSERGPKLSLGTIIGAFVAVLVGFWLIVRVAKALFWMIKVGLVLALIVGAVIAINKATSKKK